MKKILLIFLVALACVACNKEEHVETANIVMTTEACFYFGFKLSGSGTAVIDWGDGSANDTLELQISTYDILHDYNSEKSYTVSVYGKNIKSLYKHNNLKTLDVSRTASLETLSFGSEQLTSLDLSKNTALEYLRCYATQLKSLDLSANNKLVCLHLEATQFTADELNTLFKSLPFYVYDQSHTLLYDRPGEIYLSNTPGTDSCDISIAEKKGWIVRIF